MAQDSDIELSTQKGVEATDSTPSQGPPPCVDTEPQAPRYTGPAGVQDDPLAKGRPRLCADGTTLDEEEANAPVPLQNGPPRLEITQGGDGAFVIGEVSSRLRRPRRLRICPVLT